MGTPNTRVLEQAISGVADKFGMEWKLFYDNQIKRVAILVSRMDHCLYDILIRHRAGASVLYSRPLSKINKCLPSSTLTPLCMALACMHMLLLCSCSAIIDC